MQYTVSDERRFWSKVDRRQDDECWLWIGHINDGYGEFSTGTRKTQKRTAASRVSYELKYGPIPYGLFACHHCDNPICVNPNHLFLGTHQDNMDDKVAKGRATRIDGNAKLTFEIAEQIRADKRPYSALMEAYGVGKTTISYIKNDRIWKASERV